ncbi:MAG: nuclear transport factor 2 family protein [Pseudomonadota bacterium]
MSLIERFVAQRGVFEQIYVNGDWQALAPFFESDVVYEVMNMPFHCVIRGRDAFFAGMQRSIEGFDKHCIRTMGIDSRIREEGNNVIVNGGMRFEREGAPPFSCRVWEIATYRGDRIERMVDLYEAGSADDFARWMDAWGEGLDPRYV